MAFIGYNVKWSHDTKKLDRNFSHLESPDENGSDLPHTPITDFLLVTTLLSWIKCAHIKLCQICSSS